jgi:hypothetical protein
VRSSREDLDEICGGRRAGKPTPALGIRGLDRHAMSIRAGFPTPTVPTSSQEGT